MRKIAREVQRKHAHDVIDVSQFKAICEEAASQKLDWFFNEWVETNGTLDYSVGEVRANAADQERGWIVSFDPGKGLVMPVEVLMEFSDGSTSLRRAALDERQVVFASDKDWRRVVIDPSQFFPDVDRANNVLVNPKAAPIFDILDVNLGDRAWGLNQLTVKVRNNSDAERPLFIHIGGSRGGAGPGFGMGQLHTVPPHVEHWVTHWYYIQPAHAAVDVRVKFIDPIDPNGRPQDELPFMTRTFRIEFPMPNDRCNNLTITEELPSFKKWYGTPAHLGPFRAFADDNLVLYCSPGTPAFNYAAAVLKVRKLAFQELCAFAGVAPEGKIAFFMFPDRATKLMCTLHQGDGFARGNEIYEVYNDKTRVDPRHELCHIVMGRIGHPPAVFNEGLAVWMQEGHRWRDEKVDRTARNLLEKEKLIPLAELLKRGEIGSQPNDGDVAYPESASFVGFLLDVYGKDNLLAAYRRLEDADNLQANLSTLKGIYGKDLRDLEAEWHQRLRAAAP